MLFDDGTGQTLRRRRVRTTRHRSWEILPRYGTGPDDRWTLIGTPVPAPDNPAATYEDGQYPTLQIARRALTLAVNLDDGTHQED